MEENKITETTGEVKPGETTTQTETTQESNSDKDYKNLDKIISKRVDTILESFFKKEGLTEEQIKVEKEKFKTKTDPGTATAEPNKEFEDLKKEIETLKKTSLEREEKIKKELIEKEVLLTLKDAGVDEKKNQYILKLLDLNDTFTEDGKINSDKIKKDVEKLLTDIPEFKTTTATNKNFLEVGGKKSDSESVSEEEKLRKMFGLPNKKI